MITKIKTALLGDEFRTDGGWISPGHDAINTEDTRIASDGRDIDPFPPATDHADGANQAHVGLDQIFGILRNQRRRYVLKHLSMTEGTITLSDLAERIAAWEGGKGIARVTSKERKCVYTGLYQCHLPKMADASAISYDKRSGDIESGAQFDRFSRYLRHDE